MDAPCLQTVFIQYPNAPFAVQTLEIAPQQPKDTLAMRTDTGDTIFWYPDMIRKWTKEGTIYTWWKKPTLQYIYQRKTDGSYYQFNKDGSIYARENDYYYWSKPLDSSEAIIVTGTKLNIHVCHGEYFLTGERCMCGWDGFEGNLEEFDDYACSYPDEDEYYNRLHQYDYNDTCY
jgi:hypothetical protein